MASLKPEGKEVEFVFQDESRFGTLTSPGRSWKRKGEDFNVRTKMGRENLYVFGAVTPGSGSLFTETCGKSNTEAMNDFLKKFSARKAGKHVVMLPDRAGWHATGKLETPENISLVFLPPVSPQLNPIERLWKKIKTDFFHNRIRDGIEDVKASVAKALATLTAMVVASICACSYLDACL